jgi:hypothetical protein
MAIQPGLYEQLITQALKQELDKLDKGLKSITTRVDTEESHGILARYMEQYLAGILARVKGRDKLVKQIAVCNELIFSACNAIEKDQEGHGLLDLEGRRLLQVFDPALANSPRPETPLSVGALLTATSGDPSLVSQLKQEMLHADGVDMLVSFIKWSGIRIIKDELKALTRHGKLRVITTSYLGATDLKAVEFLLSLPNTEVRVSFNPGGYFEIFYGTTILESCGWAATGLTIWSSSLSRCRPSMQERCGTKCRLIFLTMLWWMSFTTVLRPVTSDC